ncbi:unnamed protein product [Calicophoron daubneyi]|uniref:Uncharacterized protein n=1 Tax=Calicophoron daubneyi TaxID=300641 RepID=A0AAV2U066_CALDB
MLTSSRENLSLILLGLFILTVYSNADPGKMEDLEETDNWPFGLTGQYGAYYKRMFDPIEFKRSLHRKLSLKGTKNRLPWVY